MTIKQTNLSAKNENGEDISGQLFDFRFEKKTFFGRVWDSHPLIADLLNWRDEENKLHVFMEPPYEDSDFCEVVRFFRDQKHMQEVGIWSRKNGKGSASIWITIDFKKI